MPLPSALRPINKRYLNRLTAGLARSSFGPFCILYHVGRRSGKSYQTPIIAYPDGDSFVVALTYGLGVDWYRNILAAGRCKLLWHKREYSIDKIETLAVETALPHFPLPARLLLPAIGVRHFIRLQVGASGPA